MDLVRHILVTVEKADAPVEISDLVPPDHTSAEVAFHVNMMRAHGLVDATGIIITDAGSYVKGRVDALTWDGYDYLEAIRDDTVWRKTKDAVKKAVGSTTLSLIKQTAELVAMGAIRTQLGM